MYEILNQHVSLSKTRKFCTYTVAITAQRRCRSSTFSTFYTRFPFLHKFSTFNLIFSLSMNFTPPPAPHDPFRTPSINRFTSAMPFPTTFSISSPALWSTSGRTLLLSSRRRSFFLCAKRAKEMAAVACSPCLATTSTTAERDSRVGGGSATCNSSGLVADAVGASEWGELFRAERMGLRCCAREKPQQREGVEG